MTAPSGRARRRSLAGRPETRDDHADPALPARPAARGRPVLAAMLDEAATWPQVLRAESQDLR